MTKPYKLSWGGAQNTLTEDQKDWWIFHLNALAKKNPRGFFFDIPSGFVERAYKFIREEVDCAIVEIGNGTSFGVAPDQKLLEKLCEDC